MDGGNETSIVATVHNERGGAFSPDGRWIAYVSDETGQDEIYVQSYPQADGRWKVSIGGGREVRWRGDSRELYYRTGEKMMAVALHPGEGFLSGEPTELFRGNFVTDNFANACYDVTRDGQRFIMVRTPERSPAQLSVMLSWTGQPRKGRERR